MSRLRAEILCNELKAKIKKPKLRAELSNNKIRVEFLEGEIKTTLAPDVTFDFPNAEGFSGDITLWICFYQTVSNGVAVDWGDGSTVESFSGSGEKHASHTFHVSTTQSQDDPFFVVNMSGVDGTWYPKGKIYESSMPVGAFLAYTLSDEESLGTLDPYSLDETALETWVPGNIADNICIYGNKMIQIDEYAIIATQTIIHFYCGDISVNSSGVGETPLTLPDRYIYYHQPVTETTMIDNVLVKGESSKLDRAYYVYTDDETTKNLAAARADSYTTVTCYHLDGTEW